MNLLPFPKLMSLLLEAYPCTHFCPCGRKSMNLESKVISDSCLQAIWNPKVGHIPRGFLGATGKAKDVKVIMVFAEPGKPHDNEEYGTSVDPNSLMESCIKHTYNSMKNGKDQFHKNVRWFLNEILPESREIFDEQLRYVWMTESRLCSIKKETGDGPRRICANLFLKRQIELMPNAQIIGFGKNKAQKGLNYIGVDFIPARALAPPGANHKPAKPSWENAIEIVQSKRN